MFNFRFAGSVRRVAKCIATLIRLYFVFDTIYIYMYHGLYKWTYLCCCIHGGCWGSFKQHCVQDVLAVSKIGIDGVSLRVPAVWQRPDPHESWLQRKRLLLDTLWMLGQHIFESSETPCQWMACRKELVMSMWVAQFRLSISPILSIFFRSFLGRFCLRWMEAMQHESVNKLWTGDNGGILRCWDVLLASLRPHLDCLIVWFFGRVFFFYGLGISTSWLYFWQVNASGKGVVCDFNSVVLQYHPASMESIDHRLTDATQKIIEASQRVGSRGWLYGQDLELWCESKWRIESCWIFSWFCWWKTRKFIAQKVCSHSSGMGFIDTKAGAVEVSVMRKVDDVDDLDSAVHGMSLR